MQKCIVFNYTEIGLKKGNRKYFENLLFDNLKKVGKKYNLTDFKRYRGRYILFYPPEIETEQLLKDFSKIFGINNIFIGYFIDRNFDTALEVSKELLKNSKTFKVSAKRIDKTFTPNSMEININFGAEILEALPDLKVDVKTPETLLHFEVFKDGFLIYKFEISGYSGLPYGSAGKAISLLSGGIDSPVATWMMMKRGCKIIPIHFHTPPYTGEGSLEKVKKLAKILAAYTPDGFNLYIVNMTKLQIAIKKYARQKNITILSRRIMAKIAMEIAEKEKALAIITGEALSQVASQTLDNLNCVNDVYKLPVFRPLIGFDKNEIIEKAKQIGTYETSIGKEIDCCHLFSPSHPETKGKPHIIKADEEFVFEKLDEFSYEVDILKIV
jgi:thiamine biosynthesis protein ThiI